MKNRIQIAIFSALIILCSNVAAQPGKGPKGNRMQGDSARMAGIAALMRSSCTAKPEYKFISNMVVTMVSTQPGKDSTRLKNRYLFDDSGNYVGFEMLENNHQKNGENKSIGIRNLQDSTMVMLFTNGEKKNGMCNSFKDKDIPAFVKRMQAKDTAKNTFKKMVKTGKTKTICGFVCEEYTSENNKANYTFWFTQDAGAMVSKFNKGLRAQEQNIAWPAAYKGMMMEMTSVQKDNSMVMDWKVVEVNKNAPRTISTAGYFTH